MEKIIQFCTNASHYDGPFDSKVGWRAAGMGYLIVTENGKLIAIDGGEAEDAEAFLALMEQNAGGKVPEVDLWILTHAHDDHDGVIKKICAEPELSKRVRIRKIVYRFPAEYIDQQGKNCNLSHISSLEQCCEKVGARAICPHADERMVVDGI